MVINKIIGIAETPARADNEHEQIDSGIRMGDSTVMLSTEKHLHAQRERPFAALRVTRRGQRDRPFAAAQGDSVVAGVLGYRPALWHAELE